MTDVSAAGGPIRGARRRAPRLGAEQLVRASRLEPSSSLPLVYSPVSPDVDLAGWAAAHREEVLSALQRHGAVYFSGFGLASPEDFERAAGALVPDLFGEYGDLPREAAGEKIFTSTPYPPDKMIHYHNESSHMSRWPMKIFFFSALAAQSGGQTPVLDCRAVLDLLRTDHVERFERLGLRYVRNFAEGVDVSWQQFFQTEDPHEVERRCAEAGAEASWVEGQRRLRVTQPARAVHRHPATGDRVFFNQVLLHHPAALDPRTRSSLLELFGPEGLPRNVFFGDGSVIEDAVVEHLLAVYHSARVAFEWTTGDMLMLDNMLVAHGRMPFTGPRKTLVAMGDMFQG
jgi:alpha-ketoglutarate-dependent taurine dioxygenase